MTTYSAQAKRIQNLFDDMKSANSDIPGLPKTQPPALKAEFNAETIKQSAEDVAETIFAALKNNNSPAPNHGLKVLSSTSLQRITQTITLNIAGDLGKFVTAESCEKPVFRAIHSGSV